MWLWRVKGVKWWRRKAKEIRFAWPRFLFFFVPLSRVGDDGVVTGRDHNHGLGLTENRLVVLASEGLGSTLRKRGKKGTEVSFF